MLQEEQTTPELKTTSESVGQIKCLATKQWGFRNILSVYEFLMYFFVCFFPRGHSLEIYCICRGICVDFALGFYRSLKKALNIRDNFYEWAKSLIRISAGRNTRFLHQVLIPTLQPMLPFILLFAAARLCTSRRSFASSCSATCARASPASRASSPSSSTCSIQVCVFAFVRVWCVCGCVWHKWNMNYKVEPDLCCMCDRRVASEPGKQGFGSRSTGSCVLACFGSGSGFRISLDPDPSLTEVSGSGSGL